jgi:hypothetical protein
MPSSDPSPAAFTARPPEREAPEVERTASGAASGEASPRGGSAYRAVWRLALFCLPIALVVGVAEVGLRRVDNSYTKKLRALEQRKDELEVLVTGTSTGLYGIDPALFSAKGLNMANVSQSPYYDDALVRPRLGSLPKLRLLMVVLSTPSLEMRLGDSPEYWRQYWYERFWGIAPEVPHGPFDARQYSVAALYPRGVEVQAARRGFHYDVAPQITDSGFFPFVTDGHMVTDTYAADRTLYHKSIMRPENLTRNVEALSRLVAAARARSLPIAVVLPPTSVHYQRMRDPEAFGRTVGALAQLRSEGAKIANYLDDPRFDDGDFADPDHLGAKGAVKFSKVLDEELVKPAMR